MTSPPEKVGPLQARGKDMLHDRPSMMLSNGTVFRALRLSSIVVAETTW